jgi:hypothetical protein
MGAEMTTLLENYERGLRVHTTQCVVSYAAPQRRKRATIASPRRPRPARLGDALALQPQAFRIGRSERQA